ncbi:hypothetical protein NDU88_001588 [Pleurodeles waltl]|uniref:Uncharacterized protein n=1 Tax=Pleurodeles waltl TaxID=8319 RepID=A0AAV7P7I2_PLEWA|nr:hypothetical protein NDU88_001588 [Pleurodeles waltl]
MSCPQHLREKKNVTGTSPARGAKEKLKNACPGRARLHVEEVRRALLYEVCPASPLCEFPGRARRSGDPCRGPRAGKELKIASPPALVSSQRRRREALQHHAEAVRGQKYMRTPSIQQHDAQAVFPREGNAAQEPEGQEPRANDKEGQKALKESGKGV